MKSDCGSEGPLSLQAKLTLPSSSDCDEPLILASGYKHSWEERMDVGGVKLHGAKASFACFVTKLKEEDTQKRSILHCY